MRRGQHARRVPVDARVVLPPAAPAGPRPGREAAGRDDAQEPAAPPALRVVAAGAGRGPLRARCSTTPVDPAQRARAIVLCRGQALLRPAQGPRGAQGAGDVALVRLEQLYPFPPAELAPRLARYPRAAELVWAQEEPRNMGAWRFVREQFLDGDVPRRRRPPAALRRPQGERQPRARLAQGRTSRSRKRSSRPRSASPPSPTSASRPAGRARDVLTVLALVCPARRRRRRRSRRRRRREMERINWMEFREWVPARIETSSCPWGRWSRTASPPTAGHPRADGHRRAIAPRANALTRPWCRTASRADGRVSRRLHRARGRVPGYVRSVLQGLAANKFRNIVMINGHGGGQTAVLARTSHRGRRIRRRRRPVDVSAITGSTQSQAGVFVTKCRREHSTRIPMGVRVRA